MTHQGESEIPSASITIVGISMNDSIINNSWLIDSGATNHMTGNCHSFSIFSLFPKPIIVSLANGRFSPAYGKGSVYLTPDLTLKNVLFVPSFPTIILSVYKLCVNSKCRVLFTPTHCLFRNYVSGK